MREIKENQVEVRRSPGNGYIVFGPGPMKALDTGSLTVLGSESCIHVLTLTHSHFSGGG